MEQIIMVLQHGGLSLAGLLIYSLISIRNNIKNFDINIFWHDNKPFWIWAFSLQIIFSFLIAFIPESADAVSTLSGIDLTQPMAFLTSGAALAGIANWAVGTTSKDNKIGTKSQPTI